MLPITSEDYGWFGGLRLTAALHYQVANGDNNNENGYDGHPVKSHR